MSPDYEDQQPPASLTPVERQTLLLLHQVLSHLETDEADYHEKMVEVLTEGFTLEYDGVFTPYAELSKADSKLVFDILNMFRVIKASFAELPPAEQAEITGDYNYTTTFQGFDGNDAREGKMASYVTFLQKTDRWTDLRDEVEANDGGNSHREMLGLYEAMLDVYRPIWADVVRGGGASRYHLSGEQVRRVAEARPWQG